MCTTDSRKLLNSSSAANRELSLLLCYNLEGGMDMGERETQEGGKICNS